MYSGMTPKALDWQKKIRKFVNDELIPWEVHAEKNDGELPKDIEKKHRDFAISLGLSGMGISKENGGLGLNMFEQMIIWEQFGRVTNALCWCFSEAQDWMESNFNDFQKENYLKPLLNGTKKECYAITEKGAGSDVDGSIETTAEKKGDKYIINGEKWYVTSANLANFFFLQAKIKSGQNKDKHSLFIIDKDTKGIELIDPLGFFDFTYLEKNAFCLLTDSGTVPEEALYFKKPCVTIRETTERPEIIEAGSNILSGLTPENMLRSAQSITSGKPDWQWNEALGDGKTARKVINILHGKLY